MERVVASALTPPPRFLEESKGDHTHCPVPMTVELRPQLNDPDHIDAGFLLPTDQVSR